ncbi:universal stress protein [Carboxylicivirga caseinilyticus]|uniref:universal stress protein n=1 Tax=Carboxylicivirga caseinilyticus TaxID=3417572 RepID=UPI002AA60E13|nr:universal stress protein [uncultured Carboxylicivirga sp.]MCU4166479.1 universal stress protein [Marinilabiliaceae bacterium A049]
MEGKIITLVVLTFERAHVLKSLLESEDIECFLENTNLIQGAVSTGVKVRIPEDALEGALKVLESMMQEEFKLPTREQVPPRILLPVDFSEYSKKAAIIAIDWAAVLGAELTVLHTYFNPILSTMPFSDSFAYEMNLEDLASDLEDKAIAGMNKFKAFLDEKNELLGDKKITIKTELEKGVAEDEIISYSKVYMPLVIIMGTRGKDKKVADLIGSVTAEVVERAKVPVLAVPEDFHYKGIDKLKNILYATDFMDGDFKAIRILEKIAKPLDMKVVCAHVSPRDHLEWDDVKLKGLKEHFKKIYGETHVDCDLIEHEDLYIALESYVREKDIDILSFTRRRRSLISKLFNPNIAKKMLFHSNTPLLVFND